MRMRRVAALGAVLAVAMAFVATPIPARAIGEGTQIELVGLALPGLDDPRSLARGRLAWALRMRTSLEVRLDPRRVAATDPALFETPLVVLAGNHAFPMPDEASLTALRRFIELGGFVLVDDSSDGDAGFDTSVRALLRRTLPNRPLRPVASNHTIYHSFYLVERPVGRIEGPPQVEGIEIDDRLAVVYSRHDLGGAFSRDALGSHSFEVVPGGEEQRERAFRFGVNLVMYALCLDYKDDQVHVPFIMRRRPGQP
jgi:hypothetical protein